MTRRPPCSAFTLVEMLVVMTVIAILTGLILSLNGLVQNTSARSRAASEIRAMAAACEAYKADNGGYPQGSPSTVSSSGSGTATTDKLDPNPLDNTTVSTPDYSPADYAQASLFLWQQLSGHWSDVNPSQAPVSPSGTNYAGDFFKNTVLSGTPTTGQMTTVNYIQDPFGNPYCYSTAGLLQEQTYRANVLTGTQTPRSIAGFNPTFDLWSTAGATTSGGAPKWVKNW